MHRGLTYGLVNPYLYRVNTMKQNMKTRNFVQKYLKRFCKATVEVDRKKELKPQRDERKEWKPQRNESRDDNVVKKD